MRSFIENSGKEWKEFKVSDLFECVTGDTDLQKKHYNGKGDIVVTSGFTDNGIAGKTDVEAKKIEGYTLTLDMFGNCFFRDYTYKMVTHGRVFALIPKTKITSSKVGLFVDSLFKDYKIIFQYSDTCSWKLIKDRFIKLPVCTSDEPDYEYMEEYIKSIEESKVKCIKGILNYTPLTSEELQAINIHKEFRLGDLFEVKTTKFYKVNKEDLFDVDGINPVVSNSGINNGISGYTNRENTTSGNLITYSDTTTAKTIFYQDSDFVGYSHVKGLYPCGNHKDRWTKHTLLYFMSLFKQAALQLSITYGNKFTDETVLNITIKLPTTSTGEPAYELMENYIKAIEKLCVQKVYNDGTLLIEKTKEVINC